MRFYTDLFMVGLLYHLYNQVRPCAQTVTRPSHCCCTRHGLCQPQPLGGLSSFTMMLWCLVISELVAGSWCVVVLGRQHPTDQAPGLFVLDNVLTSSVVAIHCVTDVAVSCPVCIAVCLQHPATRVPRVSRSVQCGEAHCHHLQQCAVLQPDADTTSPGGYSHCHLRHMAVH